MTSEFMNYLSAVFKLTETLLRYIRFLKLCPTSLIKQVSVQRMKKKTIISIELYFLITVVQKVGANSFANLYTSILFLLLEDKLKKHFGCDQCFLEVSHLVDDGVCLILFTSVNPRQSAGL